MSRRHVIVLVVLALTSVGAGLLVTAVFRVRVVAERMSCSGNFSQLGFALHNYAAWQTTIRSQQATIPHPDLAA